MGNTQSKNIGFEAVQAAMRSQKNIIHVMEDAEPVLIVGTVPAADEVAAVELAIKQKELIIVYGKNCCDPRVDQKCAQLLKLGANVSVYRGGLFEWLLLQDYYGAEFFPTTAPHADPLKYSLKTALS
jgi:hypothetical protein